MTCRDCHCTEKRACVRECRDGILTCRWVAAELCSFCYYNRVAMIYEQEVQALLRESSLRSLAEPTSNQTWQGGQA